MNTHEIGMFAKLKKFQTMSRGGECTAWVRNSFQGTCTPPPPPPAATTTYNLVYR